MARRMLGALSPARFLAEYWRKKPLLVRGAWLDFHDPLTPEELAGLACESAVESWLMVQPDRATPVEMRHGPFTDDDFLTLPDHGWMLSVRDVENHAPDLAALLEPFRFIPDWRCDGLTVHYAMPPAETEPCGCDSDVFILQGQGRRQWWIGAASADGFSPDHEWLLEPGDLLYLPLGVTHRSATLVSGFHYAVAFRTPSQRELLSRFAEFLLEDLDPDARLAEPDLTVQDHPGEIGPAAFAQVRALLRRAMALDDETINGWFGRYLSTPKPGFAAEPELEPYAADEVQEHLRNGGQLERNPGARFYFSAGLGGDTVLFVNGQEFALGPKAAFMAPLLCQHRVLTPALLRNALKQSDARRLLLDLLNEGHLVIYEADSDERV